MKLRRVLQGLFATITLLAAGACVASGNLWVAGGMVVCAIAVAVVPLAQKMSRGEVKTLIESLRRAPQEHTAAVKAVVTSKFIFIARSAIDGASSNGYALLFRDEMDVAVWRELATFLRHQAHPHPEPG